MATNFTITDFFKKFPTDDACLEHVMHLRYGKTCDCPKCGKHAKFARIKKMPAYACPWCGHHIHPMAGTPFERTRTPLQKWFYAIYLFTTTRHGVPAKELQRQLGVTYKTAWRIGHEIRKYMGKVDGDSGLSGHVEVDETYVGGKKPGKRGRGAGGKTIVMGMIERGGNLMTHVVPNVKKNTLQPIIEMNVKSGSLLSTDELRSYIGLAEKGYVHNFVNHSAEQWVNGDTHVNTVEGFWSHFKNSVRGTHKRISKKHMMNYLAEFEFRFNLRRDVSNRMFDRLIQAF
ncbi:MAG: IS1595 family transposase [Candidatus Thiodiazotropha sp.]